MTTTATLRKQVPLAGCVLQVWRVSAGASDTSATWKTGLNRVILATCDSQDDSSHGTVPNSNNGTEDSVKGDVYLAGVINSAICDVLVIGN